jgi:hypothetical protein
VEWYVIRKKDNSKVRAVRAYKLKLGKNDRCQAVLGLLKEQNDVARVRDNLIEITSDGIIDDEEKQMFESIMDELLDLELKIEEVKTALIMSIPAMMQKKEKDRS